MLCAFRRRCVPFAKECQSIGLCSHAASRSRSQHGPHEGFYGRSAQHRGALQFVGHRRNERDPDDRAHSEEIAGQFPIIFLELIGGNRRDHDDRQ